MVNTKVQKERRTASTTAYHSAWEASDPNRFM